MKPRIKPRKKRMLVKGAVIGALALGAVAGVKIRGNVLHERAVAAISKASSEAKELIDRVRILENVFDKPSEEQVRKALALKFDFHRRIIDARAALSEARKRAAALKTGKEKALQEIKALEDTLRELETGFTIMGRVPLINERAMQHMEKIAEALEAEHKKLYEGFSNTNSEMGGILIYDTERNAFNFQLVHDKTEMQIKAGFKEIEQGNFTNINGLKQRLQKAYSDRPEIYENREDGLNYLSELNDKKKVLEKEIGRLPGNSSERQRLTQELVSLTQEILRARNLLFSTISKDLEQYYFSLGAMHEYYLDNSLFSYSPKQVLLAFHSHPKGGRAGERDINNCFTYGPQLVIRILPKRIEFQVFVKGREVLYKGYNIQ